MPRIREGMTPPERPDTGAMTDNCGNVVGYAYPDAINNALNESINGNADYAAQLLLDMQVAVSELKREIRDILPGHDPDKAIHPENIHVGLTRIRLEIAEKDYSGPRYISHKQTIADTFTQHVYTDEIGAISDECLGRVWVVYRQAGKFTCRRVQ